ncbi:peptidase S9 [Thermoplasmatales archaeon SM1-50]|nr:MAG: peptidase S9 [Thermoplasmatales archaeon SM1-50]
MVLITFGKAETGVVPELIPREVLFGNPVRTRARLSPDGKFLAYLAPVDNVLNVWIRTIGAEDDRPVTKDENRGIRYYSWAEDSKHILYAQDAEGNENWRMYAVDLEANEIKDLTPFENVQVQFIETNKSFPNEVIFSMNREDPKVHDLYHLDLASGKLNMITKNPGDFIDWIIDPHFKVRGAIAAKVGGGFDLMVRDNEEDEWEILVTWDTEDGMTSAPNFLSPPTVFSKDGKHIYLMDSRNANAGRLVKLEIATGNMEVLVEDQQYDVSEHVLLHPVTNAVQAAAVQKARLEWTVLDRALEDDFNAIAALERGDSYILSRDKVDNTWLIAFEKDNGPVTYYVYDRLTKQGTYLFSEKPDLDQYTLVSMEPISFTSRDGLIIHGYITYPAGKDKKNLPMVLDVHGGPWARNSWEFDPQAQWFANRGYACLQVNFRGSIGYGKEFVNAGDKEFGGKAQDDLVDAVNWAIEKGIADPERIAIWGGSYGGYAALVGATFTPDLFCCAVDMFGPSNLITFIEAIPPWFSTLLATVYKRMGNPETEAEFLKSRSPLFKVGQIKIPILIAQGANDPRVKQIESEQIVEAMKQKGIEYEYIVFPDEGHGFRKPQNRLKFYAAAEKFLAKHLGGRYEEATEKSNQ